MCPTAALALEYVVGLRIHRVPSAIQLNGISPSSRIWVNNRLTVFLYSFSVFEISPLETAW